MVSTRNMKINISPNPVGRISYQCTLIGIYSFHEYTAHISHRGDDYPNAVVIMKFFLANPPHMCVDRHPFNRRVIKYGPIVMEIIKLLFQLVRQDRNLTDYFKRIFKQL